MPVLLTVLLFVASILLMIGGLMNVHNTPGKIYAVIGAVIFFGIVSTAMIKQKERRDGILEGCQPTEMYVATHRGVRRVYDCGEQ